MILTDFDDIVLACNPAASQLCGNAAKEFIGNSISILNPDDGLPRFRDRTLPAILSSAQSMKKSWIVHQFVVTRRLTI